MARRKAPARKVDYSLLHRFTELILCSRCFKRQIRQPVRQLLSGRHRPLAMCHDCASQAHADYRAPVHPIRQYFHY